MSRWEKIKEKLADLFKPCYTSGQSKFEQPTNSTSSFEENQNSGNANTQNDKVEEESEKAPPIRHSYFPDISSNEDLLGFKSYAETLADLIANPKTLTPLTIGIFGAWGSGKSTLMNMIQNKLEEKGQASKHHFVTIQFNAWKYSREDALHRAIILRVLDSLRPSESDSLNRDNNHNSNSGDSLTKDIERLEQRLYRDVEWEEKGRLTIDWPKFIKGGTGSALKLSYSFLPGLAGLTEAVKAAQGAFGKGEVANDAATLFEAFQRDVVKHHQVQLRHIEQFQDQFDNLISTYFPDKRIVIFVDDLDRCLPEKTIEVLEAIKLFMDVKRCIFVLGLDQQLISRAIQHRYKDLQPGDKEKLAFDGARYLEKIVQLPFTLPPLEVGDMHNYVESLNADWPETPPDTSCAAVLAEGLPSNPRQIKRTINIFLLLWKLAENRRDKIGDAITPLRLVKVVVLQMAYPVLFEELKLNPSLLPQLEAYSSDPSAQVQGENAASDASSVEDLAKNKVQQRSAKYDPIVVQTLLQRTGASEPGLKNLFLYFCQHEIARFSGLSETELRAFFSLAGRLPTEVELTSVTLEPPKLTAIPNNIPRSSVVNFVGRNSELKQLHQLLQQTDRIALTAISGLGGIGKTELALQYCLTYQQDYSGGICWLRAKETDVGMQIVNFAKSRLGLMPPQELELTEQVAFCWQRWVKGNVLVVLDDLSDYSAIRPYLPPLDPRFKILVTSRLLLGPPFNQLSINQLSQESALELLKSLIGEQRLNQELQDAKALCEWLGYLPLGLDLVGRYLALKPDLSLQRMQERLRERSLEEQSLSSPEGGMTAAQGVKTAFELSWSELSELEQRLASILSLFALTPIPWELVIACFEGENEEDIEDLRDRGLINRSLLQRSGENAFQLHQLIREFFRTKLEQSPQANDRKRTFSQIMASVAQSIPQSLTLRDIEQLSLVIPHLREVATQLTAWVDDENLFWVFVGLARFYEGQGALAQAEPWYEQCLSVCRDRLGEDHPDVATSLNNLASLHSSQGLYSEAEPLYQQALALSRQILGEDHPAVATSLNNLASLYRSQGRYSEAEPLYQQALAMRRQILGEGHPNVASSLNNLAEVYRSQGRYSEAEPLYQQALALSRQVLGEEHPYVASSLNNLALLYASEGRYSEAEPLYQQALALSRQVLGEEHPDVAQSLNNLAFLYYSQGRYSEAEPLYVQALALNRQQFGKEHPTIASSLNNLAALYRAQARYSEAEPLYMQALELSRQLLGTEHPDVATSLNNLALLYDDQGRYQDSEPLYLQSLELRKRLLGEQHPAVAASLNNLAYSYAAQGRKEEAKTLYQQALKIAEEQLGSDHPTTIAIRKNLEAL